MNAGNGSEQSGTVARLHGGPPWTTGNVRSGTGLCRAAAGAHRIPGRTAGPIIGFPRRTLSSFLQTGQKGMET
ncbi:hypothetical protein GCM10017788_63960 [Amycolatopsis acidiphila]|nr:hypothetical protein GCM10017788_63960 [Amycolatopsis acidiphila]